jgi:putative transposase
MCEERSGCGQRWRQDSPWSSLLETDAAACPLRIECERAVYHVPSGGNARQRIYFTDSDRDAFLEVLADAVDRYGWLRYAYCVMTNHCHLLVGTPNANLTRGVRHLNNVYAQCANRRNE